MWEIFNHAIHPSLQVYLGPPGNLSYVLLNIIINFRIYFYYRSTHFKLVLVGHSVGNSDNTSVVLHHHLQSEQVYDRT